MLQNVTQIIKNEIKIWRKAAIPGVALILMIIITRLGGYLQFLEWMLLDQFLRMRPSEPMQEKIVIVGINEEDIQKIGRYPIPDGEIAALIKRIQSYKPRVIGLDIFKNVSVEPGSKELLKVFKESQNIIGIEKIFEPDRIASPPSLSTERVGFVDIIADRDGKYRRYLLLVNDSENWQNVKYSLSLHLAEAYLSARNISIENGIRNPDAVRFGSTEIPVFESNTGGYIKTDDGGIQMLMNFRNGKQRFRILSLHDVKNHKINRNWLQNKIILIGITATSIQDFFSTSAIYGLELNGKTYGVEYHAQAVSQIIDAVINERPLLKTWSDKWEYMWIIIWGFIPIIIGRLTQSVWKNLLAVSASSICLISVGYFSLMWWGWWIPIAPGLIILVTNAVGLSAFAFYQHDQALKAQIYERQYTIEYTFTVIHNGPLQTLANALSIIRTQQLPQEQIFLQLEKLNREIREIGDFLKKEALNSDEVLRLGSGLILDLNKPVNELFYQVYSSTLQRYDLKYLSNIRIRTRSFEPIDDKYLNIGYKRKLCQFLEESLCNVGKHAQGAKRIQVIGKINDGWYSLGIKDNGCGLQSLTANKGTKQAKALANKLSGNFVIKSISPKGTLCEITWPLTKKYRNKK